MNCSTNPISPIVVFKMFVMWSDVTIKRMTVGKISSRDSHDNQTLDREMSINPDPHNTFGRFHISFECVNLFV